MPDREGKPQQPLCSSGHDRNRFHPAERRACSVAVFVAVVFAWLLWSQVLFVGWNDGLKSTYHIRPNTFAVDEQQAVG